MKKYAIVNRLGNVLKTSDDLLKLLKIVKCSIGPRYTDVVYERFFNNPICVVPTNDMWYHTELGDFLNVLSEDDLDNDDLMEYDNFLYYYKYTKRSYRSYVLDF